MPVSTYDSPPSSKTRRKTTEIEVHEVSSTTSKRQQSKMSIFSHLSEKVIGQHCGELLFNYSQSIGHGYIFGIVVQQTQVSSLPSAY